MGSAIAPLLLVGTAVAPGDAPIAARAAVIAGALVACVAIFVVSYDRLLVSTPLDLRLESSPFEAWSGSPQRRSASPRMLGRSASSASSAP